MDGIERAAAAAALALAVCSAGEVSAASGTALGVKPEAEVDTAGEMRVLEVGSDIFIGDNVITGPKGQVQIRFSDKTELVVGPNSALMIEDYLLREDQSAGRFAINALSGTFRFATGEAAKDRYTITTPTGTIGVRGTAFDFNVGGEGTQLLLFHGQVVMCNLDKACVTLGGSCQVGSFDSNEATLIGAAADIKGEQRRDLKKAFAYAQSQMPLMREFWVTSARECFNQGFVSNTATSLLQGTSDGLDPAPDPCDGDGYCGCDGYCE